MAWLRAADTEVKRDMEISRDEVRVMTVHGAKGLEAAGSDPGRTTTSPADTQRLRLIHVPRQAMAARSWCGPGARPTIPPCVATRRNAMLEETEHEYRRLLYVAMTRAADRLIVAGCMPGNRNSVREHPGTIWSSEALPVPDLVFEEIPAGDGVVKRYSAAGGCETAGRHRPRCCSKRLRRCRNGCERRRHREQSSTAGCARPTRRGRKQTFRTGESIALRARALQRGVLVHRLLQSLPDLATERRRELALELSRPQCRGLDRGRAEALAEKVLQLIADTRFAAVFAPGSRAEVPIVGRLERPGGPPALVSGQIDRLVVTPAEILIVDYKTNHAPPAAAADAPQGYVRQLALYRAVLAKLYPQRADQGRAALDRNA